MNHGTVLKRAWQLLKQYRALWVFGMILALTTASAGYPGSNTGYETNGDEMSRASGIDIYTGDDGKLHVDWGDTSDLEAFLKDDWPGFKQSFENWVEQRTGADLERMAITIGVIFALVMLTLAVLFAVGRYVSETALIRMVNDYEDSGEALTVRQGFRLGWNRLAWRLFLIDLVIGIPAFLAIVLLLACVAAPALLWITGNMVAGIAGTVATIGLFFLAILAIIAAVVVLNLIKVFARRLCALDGLGVRDSIRRGWEMLRQYMKEIGLMWLVTFAIKAAWPLVMIPIAFAAFVAAILVGGSLGLAAGGISALFAHGVVRWMVGGSVGVIIAVLVLMAPLLFFGGLREVYLSSTWTLTYRELRLLGNHIDEAPSGDAPLRDAPQPA